MSSTSSQRVALSACHTGDKGQPGERSFRVWPSSVSEVVRWCRSAEVEPLPESEVIGANVYERRQLAALGGVAAALAERSASSLDAKMFPTAVRRWLKEAPTPPVGLVDALCDDIQGNVDPLALLYERIVSGPRRRWLGTFFTPQPALDYIHAIVKSLPERPRVVADPGAGVGAFTVSALRWWKDCEVHAVDVNLVTLGLLSTRPNLFHRSLAGSQQGRLQVRHENFLEWLTLRWPRLPGPRLLLGNPPYTRHQQLTAAEKLAARAAAGELAPGARSGLSTYFLAASLAALRPDDALCFLLPANWLEADYARSVRQRIWSSVKRRVDLHLFSNELNVFPGAQVAAMVILIGPEKRRSQAFRLAEVSGDVDSGFERGPTAVIQRVGSTPVSFSPQKLLATRSSFSSTAVQGSRQLGVFAVVRRGVATGANSFFLRTRQEAESLPIGACVPAISRLRDLPVDDLDHESHAQLGKLGARCWLLALDETMAASPLVKELIAEGEAANIHKGYLCRTRDPWYAVENIPTPDILIGPMGKDSFRIVVNTIGAIPTNTLYGIRLRARAESNAKGVLALASWLRSKEGQIALRSAARNHHGDGLVKLEPGALKEIYVPETVVRHIMRF